MFDTPSVRLGQHKTEDGFLIRTAGHNEKP